MFDDRLVRRFLWVRDWLYDGDKVVGLVVEKICVAQNKGSGGDVGRQTNGDIENEQGMQGREEEGEEVVGRRARRVNPPLIHQAATRKDAFNQRESVVICIRESLASWTSGPTCTA